MINQIQLFWIRTSMSLFYFLIRAQTITITVYYDNINGPEYYCLSETPQPMTEFDDFECQRNIEYGYMDGLLEVISNPDMNTNNN